MGSFFSKTKTKTKFESNLYIPIWISHSYLPKQTKIPVKISLEEQSSPCKQGHLVLNFDILWFFFFVLFWEEKFRHIPFRANFFFRSCVFGFEREETKTLGKLISTACSFDFGYFHIFSIYVCTDFYGYKVKSWCQKISFTSFTWMVGIVRKIAYFLKFWINLYGKGAGK